VRCCRTLLLRRCRLLVVMVAVVVVVAAAAVEMMVREMVAVGRQADLVVCTKADLGGPSDVGALAVSALTGAGMEVLREKLDELAFGGRVGGGGLALNARHVAAIGEARLALKRAVEAVELGPEVVAMELRAFDLRALLEELRHDSLLQGVTGLGGLTWALPDSLPIVVGDPLRLKQALIALIRRAHARASAGAPPIQITADVVTQDRAHAVDLVLGTPVAGQVVTSDEGLMELIDLRSAVDSQEAQEDELALYTAMQLVDAMGAHLRIEMGATGDACYVVTLPVVEEK